MAEDYFNSLKGHRYDWDTWTDGNQHVVRAGVDYHTPTANFQSYIAMWARQHGFTVRTKKLAADSLAVQFTQAPKKRPAKKQVAKKQVAVKKPVKKPAKKRSSKKGKT